MEELSDDSKPEANSISMEYDDEKCALCRMRFCIFGAESLKYILK